MKLVEYRLILFPLIKDMHQHRWTCLATLALTTVLAPINTVYAKTLPAPAMGSGSNFRPQFPQTLPEITPLTVTDAEVETVIPLVQHAVPLVSKLPVLNQVAGKSKISTVPRSTKVARVYSSLSKPPQSQSAIIKPSASNSIFNPHLRTTVAVIANPTKSVNPISDTGATGIPVNPVAPLPVVNANSAVADRANGNQIDDRSTVVATPITAAVSSNVDHQADAQLRQDIPSFEAGLPMFIFESERTQYYQRNARSSSTHQIVSTTIAQVGDTIVAPEQSIAIPIDPPKNSNIPGISPVPAVAQPTGDGTTKIDQPTRATQPALDQVVSTQNGKASWYGSEGGSRTANGERYNPNGLTAAHRTLPFGTKVRVTNLKNGKFVVVRINDRGPFTGDRIIDISAGAAAVIEIKEAGVAQVRMEILATK
jgi:rare lipoprotein A